MISRMRKNTAYLVRTKTGKIGTIRNCNDLINNKLIVYLDDKQTKLLCYPETLEIIKSIPKQKIQKKLEIIKPIPKQKIQKKYQKKQTKLKKISIIINKPIRRVKKIMDDLMANEKYKYFLNIFNPDDQGKSRWITKEELENTTLHFNNGFSWGRKGSGIEKKFILETKRQNDIKSGKIIAIRTNGFNIECRKSYNRPIRNDIKEIIREMNSSHSGLKLDTIVDHKNGRYNNPIVLNINTQTLDDFQPLTNGDNLLKRQSCKECIDTNIRFDAKKLGYKISYIQGEPEHDGTKNGCVGCYWYDCLKFKQSI